MTVIDWLLDSDPSVRWQVLQDLTDASAEDVALERGRVATEGTGARLLALQATDGRWRVVEPRMGFHDARLVAATRNRAGSGEPRGTGSGGTRS